MSSSQFNEGINKLRAKDPNVSITFNPERSAVSILRGRLSAPAKASELKKSPFVQARRFISENKALLGELDEGTELGDGRVFTDDSGGTHVIFYQKYGDARVMGGTISVHYGKDRTINLIKSDLVHAIDLPSKPEIGAEPAIEIAIKDAGPGAEAFPGRKPELLVVNADTANIEGKGPKNYLCWKIGIVYPKGQTEPDWIYFVDALAGKVLFRTSAIQTGSGSGLYSASGGLNSDESVRPFRLRDTVTTSFWPTPPYMHNAEIHTYDDAGSYVRTLTDYSADPDDNWNNGGEPPADHADDQRQEVDIHRFLGYAMSYFYNVHLYRSMNGTDCDVMAHAHNESKPNDAFWDAHYGQLYFSSGDWINYRFISTLNVVAHEYTHGLLWNSAIVQNYHRETGAVNEAIADLFGSLIALEHSGDCPEPWKIGQQSCITGRARDIENPSVDDMHYIATDDNTKLESSANGYYPDHYSIRYTGPDNRSHDWGGVHINSTILSYAVYLMIGGGTHRISHVTVTPIGASPVARMLFRVISTGLLNETSNFADFRAAFILACLAVYPNNLDYLVTVKKAFYAVGVGPDLYIRDTLTDQGEEPGTLSYMSPDIIVQRWEADAGTLAAIRDTTNESLGETIRIGPSGLAEDHHVYFRIFNRGWIPASGTFRLFISPVTTLSIISSWTEVGHFDFPSVPAEGHWVPTAPDQNIPLRGELIERLRVGHFCLIGIVQSNADPAPDLVSLVVRVDDRISKSNNYACRNCDIVRVDFPEMLIPLHVRPDDPRGGIPEIELSFQINWLADKRKERALEIDTRDIPEGTRIIVWMPAAGMMGTKAFTSQASKVAGDIKELPADKIQLYPMPLNELAASGDDLKLAPKAIKARELKQWSPLRFAPGTVTHLVGVNVGKDEKMDIPFMVKFSGNIGPGDATLIFQGRMNDEAFGQMSYIFRISDK